MAWCYNPRLPGSHPPSEQAECALGDLSHNFYSLLLFPLLLLLAFFLASHFIPLISHCSYRSPRYCLPSHSRPRAPLATPPGRLRRRGDVSRGEGIFGNRRVPGGLSARSLFVLLRFTRYHSLTLVLTPSRKFSLNISYRVLLNINHFHSLLPVLVHSRSLPLFYSFQGYFRGASKIRGKRRDPVGGEGLYCGNLLSELERFEERSRGRKQRG
jgi:hypothetical protein